MSLFIYTHLKLCCLGEAGERINYLRVYSFSSIDKFGLIHASILMVCFAALSGDATFVPWDSLASLLQEDDLEVKDIAASILCVVQGLRPGNVEVIFNV